MPFRSAAQKRLIYFEASKGTPWARKFLRDMGIKDLPPIRQHKVIRSKH